MRNGAMARVLAVSVAALAVGLLPVGPANAVGGGQPAAPGTYPFVVRLVMTDIPLPGGAHHDSACSGALVAPDWVITAGHCFHDVDRARVAGKPDYPTTATLGTVDLARSAGETRTVVDVLQSPANDVALARLSAPVTDITPLAPRSTVPVLGQKLELAGWGATSSVRPVPGTVLNVGEVAVGQIGPDTLGVHGVYPSADTSACVFDSGAPYFQPTGTKAGVLVAVENTGPDCPHSSLEKAARADILAAWIDQQTSRG